MLRRFIAIVLAGAALAAPLGAQEKKTVTLPANGPDVFSHILFSEHLTPLQSFQQAENDPHDSMVVILGNPHSKNVREFSRDGLKPFRKNGGTLLIATDHEWSFDKSLGITVTGVRIEKPAPMGYRREPLCPWLDYEMPTAEGPRDVREHPVFNSFQRGIATNRPSHIEFNHPKPTVKRLLNFPLEGGRRWGESPVYVAGSPKNAPSDGRVVVVAGYGTFMNCMMLQKDNDNFAFALNTVRWLREKSDGTKRQNALFVVDGEIITKFDRDLTPPLAIPVPPAAMINRLLRGLEDEGIFHKVLGGLLGDSYSRVVPFLIGLATCVLLVYGGKKFMEGRHLRDTGVPRMVGVQPGIAEAPPRSEQRQQALFRVDDPGASTRALVEQWLHSAFGVSPEDWAAAGGAAEFRAAGMLGSGRGMQRQADHILELLRVGPTKISHGDFVRLVESLPELDRAAQQGRLTLLLDGKEVRQTATT
jgi:hypothetical protein